MDNDEPKPEKQYPVSASKMSKTPSWIMLGFVLGAVFVAALPPLEKPAPPEKTVLKSAEPPKPAPPREPPQLTTIEAVFEVWGKNAVWSDDVTEVALWNDREKAYSDYYEVRRFGDVYYFRTIPSLTRRIIARGKPESPLLFTETEEQYREWLSYGRTERAIDRPAPARPKPSARPSAPRELENSLKFEAPTIPPPQLSPAPQGSPGQSDSKS